MLQHDCNLNLVDDKALLILDVARAQREVCCDQHALAVSLVHQHEATAKVYHIQVQKLKRDWHV